MKDKTFFAINLNDFHANQNGKPETNTRIVFIGAKSIEDARKHINDREPECAWFVIPKSYCDRNIVSATKQN